MKPSKYLANSELTLTPSSVEGAKTYTLQLPSSVYVPTMDKTDFIYTFDFDKDFDFAKYYIETNDSANVFYINRAYVSDFRRAGNTGQYAISAQVLKRPGRTVDLVVSVHAIGDAVTVTTQGIYFKATVMPMRSPFAR